MLKIFVVCTGGTIGSVKTDGVIDLTSQKSFRVLDMYREQYGDCDFDVIQPLSLLSENLIPHDWEVLVNTILNSDLSSYDGVIVTHGSDTLSYTSAMLGLCLCTLPLPIVITASDYVPDDPRSNALKNIRCSVKLIQKFSQGVFSVFCDSRNHAVYIPTRLCEADRFCDRFSSFDGNCLADFCEDKLIFCNYSNSPSEAKLQKEGIAVLNNELKLEKDVLFVRPYPGIDYKNLFLGENTGAVLHSLYHSATAKSDGENSMLYLLEKCKQKGIPLFCASFKSESHAQYSSSVKLIQSGAIPLYAISNECAYAKLLLACNQDKISVNDFMNREIYLETASL